MGKRTLRPVDRFAGPLAPGQDVLSQLQTTGVCDSEWLRVTSIGRTLFLDGFVDSLEQKLRVERACRKLASGSTVVNRLRVATISDRQAS